VEHVACLGEVRNAFKILVRKPARRRPLGRPRRGCEDNSVMEIIWEGVDWIHVAQDREQ